jgi:TonB family protein
MAAAQQTLPGAIQSGNVTSESQGAGSGGGAGTGTGAGIGSGLGSGLGEGRGGGTGGGAYRPGAGITLPRVLSEAKPQYTADAMRAKVQGSVWLECIVMPDGSVGDVKVTKSLDPIFGLDQEAIKAAKLWRFSPGMRQGQPVPVIISPVAGCLPGWLALSCPRDADVRPPAAAFRSTGRLKGKHRAGLPP